MTKLKKYARKLIGEQRSKEVLPLTEAEKKVDGHVDMYGNQTHIERTPAKVVRVYRSNHDEYAFVGCVQ